jgi:hypothetical protein
MRPLLWIVIAILVLAIFGFFGHGRAEDTPTIAPDKYVIVVSIETQEGKKARLRYGHRDFESKEVCDKFLEDQKQQTDQDFVQALVQLQLLLDQNHAWPTDIECLPDHPVKEETL